MRDEVINKLNEKAFVEKLITLETPEEVKKLFADGGAPIDDKEFEELKSLFKDTVQKLKELPAEELKNVAAGTSATTKIKDGLGVWSKGVDQFTKAITRPSKGAKVVNTLSSATSYVFGDDNEEPPKNLLYDSGDAWYKMNQENAEFVGATIKYGVPGIDLAVIGTTVAVGIVNGTKKFFNWITS
jgi:hypothetical protein